MDDKNEQIKPSERRIPAGEQRVGFEKETEPVPEKKEVSREERLVSDELKREIEMMELDERTKDEAKKKAEKIEFLAEKEKIEHLLQIAREKGVVFAVQVAKKMSDPYILDIFHDVLAQEGYYKNFIKK